MNASAEFPPEMDTAITKTYEELFTKSPPQKKKIGHSQVTWETTLDTEYQSCLRETIGKFANLISKLNFYCVNTSYPMDNC